MVNSQTTEEFRALLILVKTQLDKFFFLKNSKIRTPWRNDQIERASITRQNSCSEIVSVQKTGSNTF